MVFVLFYLAKPRSIFVGTIIQIILNIEVQQAAFGHHTHWSNTSSPAMAQIIYDATFFAKYPALDRSVKGLDGAPEWPRLRELPPSLRGNVIGLGCGFGWLAR
jgi:hypothetical protein